MQALSAVAKAVIPSPAAFAPIIIIGTADIACQISPFQSGKTGQLGLQRLNIKLTVRGMRQYGVKHAVLTNMSGDGACIDASNADEVFVAQPIAQMLGVAVIGGFGNRFANNQPMRGLWVFAV